MAVKLLYCTFPMMILKITLSVAYVRLNGPTNQNSIKVPKFVKPKHKKMLLYNFW